jgi:catechol 2,3-dioxygenase-like lactoylglutathione lyase family enzyme
MKLNTGIITSKIKESKAFYVEKLGFGVTHELDWFLLLHTPNKEFEISFLAPNDPAQAKVFQPEFNNKGIYLTIEIEDVDAWYAEIKEKGISIEVDIRDEPWGDRHFAIVDPNGIGIDFVQYTSPDKL